ncbi:malonyl-CoA-acyl carrier protein transacylase-like protein [Dothistroma septosporum NZE10]|uniref:[acyl-carrier-protein] S-malonyltransferase n=1 Tax=Dothistroma septosporum (strain NZE10 / CBS 128990) TaxID=675120 RepID=N1PP69_DOTSN|nr:malonyl-CoA-acyl carrier protein transacylase-like protein [Dothistroma septosporum NZE10]
MTTDWLEAFPRTVKPMLEQMDETLNVSLSKIIADGPNSRLTATENAQPAIMWSSMIILRVLEQDFGFKLSERVDITLGHSLGEFAALVAGGYLRDVDALKLVRRRAEVMARCSKEANEEVGMVALVCEANHLASMVQAIHSFLDQSSEGAKMDSHSDTDLPPVQQVMIANVNSKNQVVLSGGIKRINELLTHLRQFAGHDPRAVRLKSDSPFHSPLMKPAAELMKKMLHQSSPTGGKDQDVVIWPGVMPCISNVSARPFKSQSQLKDLLAQQCVATVLWHDSIIYLHQEEKCKRWIGIGPGKVGRNLVGKEVGMKGAGTKGGGVWGISGPNEVEAVLKDLDQTNGYEEEEEE